MTPDISILLRTNMKSFHHEVLPKALFLRNKDRLAGSLRVLATQFFPEGEKSQKGESKENWRQIDLKGDDQVMRCLRFIPESFPFRLGGEPVKIRGGLRPQEQDEQQQQQQQQHLLGKRSRSPSSSSSFAPPNLILDPAAPQNPATSSRATSGTPPQRGSFPKRGRGANRGAPRK